MQKKVDKNKEERMNNKKKKVGKKGRWEIGKGGSEKKDEKKG